MEGDYYSSREYLHQAITKDPKNSDAWQQLARTHHKLGDLPAASITYHELLKLTPQDSMVWKDLSELQVEMHQTRQAEESIDHVLALDPKHVSALIARAKLQESRKAFQDAISTWFDVLRMEPTNFEARLRLAALHIYYRDPESAAPLVREITQRVQVGSEVSANAHWLLGIAYGQQERWEDTVVALQKSMELKPSNNPNEMYRLAYAYYRAGEISQARQWCHRVQQILPNHPNSQTLLSLMGDSLSEETKTANESETELTPTQTAQAPSPTHWN